MNELGFMIWGFIIAMTAVVIAWAVSRALDWKHRRRACDEKAADRIMAQFGGQLLAGRIGNVEEIIVRAPRSMRFAVRLACHSLLAFQELRKPPSERYKSIVSQINRECGR